MMVSYNTPFLFIYYLHLLLTGEKVRDVDCGSKYSGNKTKTR